MINTHTHTQRKANKQKVSTVFRAAAVCQTIVGTLPRLLEFSEQLMAKYFYLHFKDKEALKGQVGCQTHAGRQKTSGINSEL